MPNTLGRAGNLAGIRNRSRGAIVGESSDSSNTSSFARRALVPFVVVLAAELALQLAYWVSVLAPSEADSAGSIVASVWIVLHYPAVLLSAGLAQTIAHNDVPIVEVAISSVIWDIGLAVIIASMFVAVQQLWRRTST